MTYDDIMTALTEAGIRVMYPGIKQDICTFPYVVVQDSGTYPFAVSNGLGYTIFTVHCFVPLSVYPQLRVLIESVKAALKGLEPDLMPNGNDGVHLINDRFRAHEGSVQYTILRDIRKKAEE